MTQDEKWLINYHDVMEYMTTYKRNLSKYDLDIRHLYTWVKHNRKLMNQGGMKPEREARFKQLLEMCERYKHKNQYE